MSPALTLAQVAERWGVHTETLRQMCLSGQLSHFKIGKQYRVLCQVVESIEQCGGSLGGATAGTPSLKSTGGKSVALSARRIVKKPSESSKTSLSGQRDQA